MDSKERFGDRVAQYAAYRPDYPAAAVDWLLEQAGAASGDGAADIGAGTGKLTRLLLERELAVAAVEPNALMRAELARTLGGYAGLRAVDGSAEATGLADASVTLVTAAQAFHWFDRARFGAECRRILQPGGAVALVWNRRDVDAPFMAAYRETIIRWYDGYAAGSAQEHITEAVFGDFFGGGYALRRFPWAERHTFDALWGRSLSNSHAPLAGHPHHEPLRAALRVLFDRYAEDGAVTFGYQTEVVVGRLK